MAFPVRTLPGQLVAYVTGLALAAFWVAAGAARNWGVPIPDDVHTYGIRFPRGADLFFRPVVGWYIDHGLWVCVALAGAALVVEVVARLLVPTYRKGRPADDGSSGATGINPYRHTR